MTWFKSTAFALALITMPMMATAIPNQITYQGTLKKQGVPLNGLVNMSFTFVDPSGNQLPGTSVINVPNVNVTQGLFSVPLAIPTTIDWSNTNAYLSIAIGGQTLSPPQAIYSNFYSIVSQSIIDGAVSTAKIATGAVTDDKIAPQTITSDKLAVGLANSVIPSGMIAMFNTTCPAGWTALTTMNGRVPIGVDPSNLTQFSIGETGGSSTHTHTLASEGFTETNGYGFNYVATATPVVVAGQRTPEPTGELNGDVVTMNTQAPIQRSPPTPTLYWIQKKKSVTNPSSNLPPYVAINFCQKS